MILNYLYLITPLIPPSLENPNTDRTVQLISGRFASILICRFLPINNNQHYRYHSIIIIIIINIITHLHTPHHTFPCPPIYRRLLRYIRMSIFIYRLYIDVYYALNVYIKYEYRNIYITSKSVFV